MIEILTAWILNVFLSFVPKIMGCRIGTSPIGDKARSFPADFFPNLRNIISFPSPTSDLRPTTYCSFRSIPKNASSCPRSARIRPRRYRICPRSTRICPRIASFCPRNARIWPHFAVPDRRRKKREFRRREDRSTDFADYADFIFPKPEAQCLMPKASDPLSVKPLWLPLLLRVPASSFLCALCAFVVKTPRLLTTFKENGMIPLRMITPGPAIRRFLFGFCLLGGKNKASVVKVKVTL